MWGAALHQRHRVTTRNARQAVGTCALAGPPVCVADVSRSCEKTAGGRAVHHHFHLADVQAGRPLLSPTSTEFNGEREGGEAMQEKGNGGRGRSSAASLGVLVADDALPSVSPLSTLRDIAGGQAGNFQNGIVAQVLIAPDRTPTRIVAGALYPSIDSLYTTRPSCSISPSSRWQHRTRW